MYNIYVYVHIVCIGMVRLAAVKVTKTATTAEHVKLIQPNELST